MHLRPFLALRVLSHLSFRSATHCLHSRSCNTHFCSKGVSMIGVLSMAVLQRPFTYSPDLASPAESVRVVWASTYICTLLAASRPGEVCAHISAAKSSPSTLSEVQCRRQSEDQCVTAITVEETRKMVWQMDCGQCRLVPSDVMKKKAWLKCRKRSTLVGTVSSPWTTGQHRMSLPRTCQGV